MKYIILLFIIIGCETKTHCDYYAETIEEQHSLGPSRYGNDTCSSNLYIHNPVGEEYKENSWICLDGSDRIRIGSKASKTYCIGSDGSCSEDNCNDIDNVSWFELEYVESY
jgi:hypothetical protein